jgi:hypothetical protein
MVRRKDEKGVSSLQARLVHKAIRHSLREPGKFSKCNRFARNSIDERRLAWYGVGVFVEQKVPRILLRERDDPVRRLVDLVRHCVGVRRGAGKVSKNERNEIDQHGDGTNRS